MVGARVHGMCDCMLYTVRTHQVLWCNFRRLVVSDWQVEAAPCSYHIVITTSKYRCYEYYSKHFHFFFAGLFCFSLPSFHSPGHYCVFLWFHIRNENNTDFWSVLPNRAGSGICFRIIRHSVAVTRCQVK